jgi:CBS domain-containing protein
MALVIMDAGYRIQTPVDSEFPVQGAQALTAAKPGHDSSGLERRMDADGMHFTQMMERSKPKTVRNQSDQEAYQQPTYEPPHQKTPSEPQSGLTAEKIMSQPVHTLHREQSFQAAWDRMSVLGVNHLVVIDQEDRPVGMISASDVREHGINSPVSIANFVSERLIAASPDTLVTELALACVEEGINAIPIMENNALVGIVTRSDLLRLVITGQHLERWA